MGNSHGHIKIIGVLSGRHHRLGTNRYRFKIAVISEERKLEKSSKFQSKLLYGNGQFTEGAHFYGIITSGLFMGVRGKQTDEINSEFLLLGEC